MFELEDTLLLEQSDDLPIVRVSGLDVSSAGQLLLSDAAEGNVRLFDSTGKLQRTIGAKGSGPGEFQIPFAPRFGPDGRIHVPDAKLGRISVFSPAGVFERHVPSTTVGTISDFEVLPGGEYLVAGFQPGKSRNVLFRLDASGALKTEFLPLAEIVPTGERDAPQWRAVRRPSVAVRDGRAFVVEAVSDSLWSVELQTGRTESEQLHVPDYQQPTLPGKQPRTGPEVLNWSRSILTAATVLTTDRYVMIPYVRGRINEGDSVKITLRLSDGTWHGLRNGPAIIGATRDGRLIAIRNPNEDPVILSYYRLRS